MHARGVSFINYFLHIFIDILKLIPSTDYLLDQSLNQSRDNETLNEGIPIFSNDYDVSYFRNS